MLLNSIYFFKHLRVGGRVNLTTLIAYRYIKRLFKYQPDINKGFNTQSDFSS